MFTKKEIKKEKRRKRVRAKIFGTAECPRLSVYISNKHLIGQIINDESQKTLIYVSDLDKDLKSVKGTKTEIASKVGEFLAKKAKEKKIKRIVFDRGRKLYHGRIQALAEGARKGGLEF